MAITAVSSENFENFVLKNEKTVLVDFWADWCGPCKMLAPVLEELAAAHPEIEVAKVNVDECPELAMMYRISAIPAVLAFKNGALAGQSIGFQGMAGLEALLK